MFSGYGASRFITNVTHPPSPSPRPYQPNQGGGGYQQPANNGGYNPQAVARQRWLTLVFDDMETIKVLPNSFAVSDLYSLYLCRSFSSPVSIICMDDYTQFLYCSAFQEAEALARDWINPPPGQSFHLRVPVEYASVTASRLVQGTHH